MLFKNIPGQTFVKNRLIESVKSNRVSHAQLFFGPEGCGKLALAIAYAQYINCTNKIPEDSCGVCPSCIKFNKFSHPDVHFTYPVSTTTSVKTKPKSTDFITEWRELLTEHNAIITIEEWYEAIGLENKQGIINAEECNDIITKLSFKSYESEYRFQIIWMVEKLFHAAAPKLLKILEEPPEKTIFLLITESPDSILATIKSRTQLIKIPKLTTEELTTHVMQKFGITKEQGAQLAYQTQGNLKAAYELVQEIEHNDYNFSIFQEFLRASFQFNTVKLLSIIKEISSIGRERQRSLIKYGMHITRECLLYNNGHQALIKLSTNELEWISKLAPFINHNNIIAVQEEFSKSLLHIERNGLAKVILYDLSFKLNTLLKK